MPVRLTERTEAVEVWLKTVEEDLVEEEEGGEANKLFVEVVVGVALLKGAELLGVTLEVTALSFKEDVGGAGGLLLGGGCC